MIYNFCLSEPDSKLVSVFTLQENMRYGRPDVYSDEDKITVTTFRELIIDLTPVFDNL